MTTRPYARDDHRVGPTVIGGWGGGRHKSRTEALKLNEIVLLRRIRNGETQAQAARALGLPKETANSTVRKLRIRFGVSNNADLLALPVVSEQLDEST